MCNHMEQHQPAMIWAAAMFGGIEYPPGAEDMPPQIYPKRKAVVILPGATKPVMEAMRWGVWPYYSKEKASYVTNSRSDGILTKAIWTHSVAKRRCLVPVTGYYEPGLGPTGARGEVRFTMKERPSFFIPGLFDTDPDGSGNQGFSIVTAEPNDYARRFHDRMPVVLADLDARAWLGSEPLLPERVFSLCRPCPPEWMDHAEIPAVPKGKIGKADLPPPNGELLL